MNTLCPSCHTTNRLPDVHNAAAAKCGRCQHPLFDGQVIVANASNFNKLLQDDLPVVVDFWAPWCGPCRSFAPVFAEVASQFADKIRFVKVDTEAEQQLAANYAIRSIPTIMLFKQGRRLDMINGALPANSFKQWLEQGILKG